jgi:predicted transcriptional regulator
MQRCVGKEGDMNGVAARMAVSIRLLLIVIAGASASSAVAQTGPWTERPYDPPAGSRWSVLSQSDAEETPSGGPRRERHITMRSELTIDEKTPTGFKISYVMREMSITGNTPGVEIMQTAFGAIKDIVVRGRADPSGKPFVVDNLEEVKTAMRAVVERLVKLFESKPKAAAVLKELLESMLVVNGSEAARIYMEELPTLAAGQNTRLKPGDVRREDEQIDSPLGSGRLKTVLTSRLTSWDDTAGKAIITRKREYDAASLKEAVVALVRKLVSAADDKTTPQLLDQYKDIKFTLENEAVIDVQGGMARRYDDRTYSFVSLLGSTVTKMEKKVVTVTPLNEVR